MTKTTGWLIWRGKFVEWKYKVFASSKDLTRRPHFELTVTDKDKNESITFDNVQVKPYELKGISNLLKLPQEVQAMILDNAVDTLEKVEAGDGR